MKQKTKFKSSGSIKNNLDDCTMTAKKGEFKPIEQKTEIELVKKLKNSFPDMLDFNNCLKDLRTHWEKQGIQKAMDIFNKFRDDCLCLHFESQDDIDLFNKYFEESKKKLNQELK